MVTAHDSGGSRISRREAAHFVEEAPTSDAATFQKKKKKKLYFETKEYGPLGGGQVAPPGSANEWSCLSQVWASGSSGPDQGQGQSRI